MLPRRILSTPPCRPARRTALGAAGLALAVLAGAAAAAPPPVERLIVEVRSTPPAERPAYHRASDRSYTVSTGGGEDRDDQRASGSVERSTVLRGGNAERTLHVRAGEALRVDLPARQSLQFHVGRPPGAAPAAGTSAAGSPVPAPAVAAAASGVVFFDAVAAFAARFHLSGTDVRIELVPLQAEGVAAPWIDLGPGRAAPAAGAPLLLRGRAGEWIALGDVDLARPARGLLPTAEAPSPAALWVRVRPDDAPPAQDNSTEIGTRR